MSHYQTRHPIENNFVFQLEDIISILSDLETSHTKLCDIRSEILFGATTAELVKHRLASAIRRNPLIPLLIIIYTVFACVIIATRS